MLEDTGYMLRFLLLGLIPPHRQQKALSIITVRSKAGLRLDNALEADSVQWWHSA